MTVIKPTWNRRTRDSCQLSDAVALRRSSSAASTVHNEGKGGFAGLLTDTAWHDVDDEGAAARDLATVIGRRLGLPVEQVPEETLGPFGVIFAMDQPASSTHAHDVLG